MKNYLKNSTIGLFILAIFLSPLLTSAHAFEHLSEDNDSIPCEKCDIFSESFEQDLTNGGNNSIQIKQNNIPSTFVLFTHYEISNETIVLPEFLYNKPPPLS